MKRIVAILLLCLASTAYALPNCLSELHHKTEVGEFLYPYKKAKNLHNCFSGYVYADGAVYLGEWKDGKKHGQGTYTYPSRHKYYGDKYDGEWKDDKAHGQGTYTYASGDKYAGEWKDSERTGQGTYTHASGDKYAGEWKDSKKHGQGTYTYASGDKYAGEWKDSERTGQGTYTYASGDKYAGEWKHSKKHGQGTYTYASGTIKTGVWEMNTYFGTKAEWDAKELAIEEAEKKYKRIYFACLLDKSSGVDMQAFSLRIEVEETCEAIATGPSWYEEWKYD